MQFHLSLTDGIFQFLIKFHVHNTGLIAACRRSDKIPPSNGHVMKPITNGISNGHLTMVKPHQNGHAFKSSNGSLNVVYSNGNGKHL